LAAFQQFVATEGPAAFCQLFNADDQAAMMYAVQVLQEHGAGAMLQ
jgi:hypothetical protein